MERKTDDAQQPKQLLSGLDDLPIELLVYIFSLLPTSRDIVRLRYVSRKMRSVSETSSLWRNFLWRWYDRREERSVNDVLKKCGTHIKQLAFPGNPDCMSLSRAVEMLQHCCNVTKISLGTYLNGYHIQKVAELKYLQKLEIFWINSIPIKSIIAACSKLEELVLTEWLGGNQVRSYDYLLEWVHAGFKPPNLSVVNPRSLNTKMLTTSWPKRNSQIPAGCTAHFKAYYVSWYSWDTSIIAPTFQLDFGQTAMYPLIKPSNFGLFSFKEDLLRLHNSTFNDKVVHELKVPVIQPPVIQPPVPASDICCSVSNLNIVTDFNASCIFLSASSRGILSSHLEQLSSVCPNLERLNLQGNANCLESLQGLRSIVYQCRNLQGLNLGQVHIANAQVCIQLWELLSEIKMLNRLTVQTCTMEPFGKNDTPAQYSFFELVQKFVHLENFQLKHDAHKFYNPCLSCKHGLQENYPLLLSQFPSLICCDVYGKFCNVINIITQCKLLKYFGFSFYGSLILHPSFSTVAPNQCLQCLHVTSCGSDISDIFMDSVSAHGGLESVVLHIKSVTVTGITTIIQNSPKLYTFIVIIQQTVDENNITMDLKVLKDTLKIKFSHRKLFNISGLVLRWR